LNSIFFFELPFDQTSSGDSIGNAEIIVPIFRMRGLIVILAYASSKSPSGSEQLLEQGAIL
jgi:hypothetical protein